MMGAAAHAGGEASAKTLPVSAHAPTMAVLMMSASSLLQHTATPPAADAAETVNQ